MTPPPSDAELAARQAALQAGAGDLLAAPDLAALLAGRPWNGARARVPIGDGAVALNWACQRRFG
ncbi:MAG TPA: hypothetical protein VFJ07_00265 [Streptosporangiaceae bacterium]|nr:hypothetical protein [Streptosporangiaceae bacterium]